MLSITQIQPTIPVEQKFKIEVKREIPTNLHRSPREIELMKEYLSKFDSTPYDLIVNEEEKRIVEHVGEELGESLRFFDKKEYKELGPREREIYRNVFHRNSNLESQWFQDLLYGALWPELFCTKTYPGSGTSYLVKLRGYEKRGSAWHAFLDYNRETRVCVILESLVDSGTDMGYRLPKEQTRLSDPSIGGRIVTRTYSNEGGVVDNLRIDDLEPAFKHQFKNTCWVYVGSPVGL